MRLPGVFLMVLASGATAVPAAEQLSQSALKRIGLGFEVSGEVRYDDNITQLSDRDIARLDSDPNSSRFRISSKDDWVAHTEIDIRWSHKILPRRETRFDAGLDLFRFQTNTIKNWDEYHVAVYQELTASRRHLLTLRAGVDWVSDFYLRELTDDAASFAAGVRIRHSARYDQSSPHATLGWEIIDDRLTMNLGYERADRDYLQFFSERDGIRSEWSLEARARPLLTWRFEILVGGATGHYAAEGDLPRTLIPDDDISYDHDRGWIRAVFPWQTRLRGRVEAQFESERRDFTTDHMFDLSHFGRKDNRREAGLRVVQQLGHGLDVAAEWRHLSNNATFPAGTQSQDEVTNYTEDRFGVRLRARFGAQ